MDEVYFRIVSELETLNNLNDSTTPISNSTLSDLQTLLDNALDADDTEDIDRLWDELQTKNLSAASLVRPFTTSMDSAPSHLTLLASQLYLSLLLLPNSPVFTLFTPIAFLALLRSIRRSFKQKQAGQVNAEDSSSRGQGNDKRKRGGGGGRGRGRGRGSRKNAPDDVQEDEESDTHRFDIRVLFPILEKLEAVLWKIHLIRFPDSLKSLVQTVAELPISALEFLDNTASYNRLTDLSYKILIGVLKPEHGDETITTVEVSKALSPSIFLPKSQARTSALRFITHQMMPVARENDAVRKAIVYLPRYLITKAPQRSEARAAAVEAIMDIVRAMESEDKTGFAEYVTKMSQGEAPLRLLAVDLIPMLLMSLPDPLGLDVEDGGNDWWGLRCLEVMIERCSDALAAIRSKSLSNLAQVIEYLFGDVRGRDRLKETLGFSNVAGRNSRAGLTDLLRQRCMDEKANVRKGALLLITKSTALLGGTVDGVLLKTMGIACSDPLVSIRKAATAALSEAFRKFPDESVIIEWLHSVPRLITDNESSIQEECENLFLELVVDRLSRAANKGSIHSTPSCASRKGKMKSLNEEMKSIHPEGLLIILKGVCESEVMPCVKKICTNLGKKKRLKPAIAIALQNIIKSSESLWLTHSMPIEKWTAPPGSWFLLSEVSIFLPKAVSWEFLHHNWELLDKTELDNETESAIPEINMDGDLGGIACDSAAWAGDRVFLLQTISNVSVELPRDTALYLGSNVLKKLEEFNMHSTEVNAHVKALRTLCKREANPEEGDSVVLKLVTRVLGKALEIIRNYVIEASDTSKASSFLTPPRSTGSRGKKKKTSKQLLRILTAVYTVGSLVIVCPTVDLDGIVALLHTIITSGSSKTKQKKRLPGPQVSIKNLAPSLYTHSWLTMGKICLANENLAKRYIPLFVQELEKSDCASVRNNIIVTMADFCVRYTALVDCYIPKITACLRDPCEVVRRQTFILLSKLLQRDYVKCTGVLFSGFLLSLVDESEKIKQLADFLFSNILKAKAPLLAYNNFVKAIFDLNDCHAHAGHSESQGSRTDSRLFSVRGNDEKSRSQRMHIYVSLLKQMAQEQLLATSAKLCAEILGNASDGLLSLDDITGQSVLQDALQILACKEIRIQSNRGAAADATEIDEEGGEGGGTDAAIAAKRRLVAEIDKKNLIQNAIPIFIALKRLLESKNSPLIGCLMECLCALLKDYKNEIDDILVADKQLQKELVYDMQKYEAAKAKSTVAEAVATTQKSPAYRSPSGCGPGVSRLASEVDVNGRLAEQLGSPEQAASLLGDVAAEATVKSVLRQVNHSATTPQLNSMSRLKLKSTMGRVAMGDCPSGVLESLRRRVTFDMVED